MWLNLDEFSCKESWTLFWTTVILLESRGNMMKNKSYLSTYCVPAVSQMYES